MPVLVEALVNKSIGWAALKFPYNERAKNTIKAIPGARWIDPDKERGFFDDAISDMLRSEFAGRPKAWYVPEEILSVLGRDPQFKLNVSYDAELDRLDLPEFASKLKPYQTEGAQRCIERSGYLLTFEPRVGKTPTTIAATCALLESKRVDTVIVLYPNTVALEWERQLKEWAGIDLTKLVSFDPLLTMEVNALRERPFTFIGCHYEILSQREKCLARIVDGRRYAIVLDELHAAKNRKASRYQTAKRLSLGSPILFEGDIPGENTYANGTCTNRIGLTGTEMRNRPRDLWGVMDLVRPGYTGGYWNYCKRFADAQEVSGHWVDKETKDSTGKIICRGKSNEAELAERLKLISMKVTRAEAAPWLPKMDRKVILCAVPPEQLSKYKKLERAYAARIKSALESDELNGSDSVMVAEMDRATSAAKIDSAIKQCLEHLDRGVKVRISAHHHETIHEFAARWENYFDADHPLRQYPAFRAAGYDSQNDRNESIASWKTYPTAALLITNNLSTGIGIDLSDGKVSICIEPEWVPADQQQWEDRAADVHLGKVTEPPLIIYLFVKGTLDELKAAANLSKLRTIEEIVGHGTETGALAKAFRDSGVVDASKLGLESFDKSTVSTALKMLRERLLHGPVSTDSALEAEMAAWENDENESGSEEDE